MPRAARPLASATTSDGSVRGRILSAAYAAFMERGFAGASTLEIATRAQVSKRELYAHFGSKQAMLQACIAHGAKLMSAPLEMPAAHDRDGLAAVLVAFGATFMRVILGPQVVAFYRLALNEAKRSPEVAKALDTGGRGPIRFALVDTLAAAQEAGFIGAGDPSVMAGQFFSLLIGDLHVRVLLGLIPPPSAEEAASRARAAAQALFTLYPVDPS